jgi:hypothetical protein
MGVQIFTLINGVLGAILLAGGAITTYLDTLGQARWASVVLGGLGVVQLIIANILHVIQTPPTTSTNSAIKRL